ncbi:MAG: hypothetical protein ACREPX_12455 [Rhodanobacteraceae bacterium]
MKTVAKLLAAAMLASLSSSAFAACACSCVNGQIEAVCRLPSELPPVCAPRACTVKAPKATLVNQSAIAANSTKQCHETHVLNPQTGTWVEKQVCS